MNSVRQIKVGKHNTGIVDLDNILKEIAGYGVMGSLALLLSHGYENARILEGGYPALTVAAMPPKVLQAVKASELLKV